MATINFSTGAAVTANTNVNLPTGAPKLSSLEKVFTYETGDFDAAADSAPSEKTVVTGVPAAGEVRLVDEDTVEFGDALTAFDHIELHGTTKGAFLQTT